MIELLAELEKEGRLNKLMQAGVITYKARLYWDMHLYYTSLSGNDLKKVEKVARVASKFKCDKRTVYNMLKNTIQ